MKTAKTQTDPSDSQTAKRPTGASQGFWRMLKLANSIADRSWNWFQLRQEQSCLPRKPLTPIQTPWFHDHEAFSMEDFAPVTVLVVDDVGMNRELIKDYFAGSAHRIIEAGNGREALAMMFTHRPEVVLLDARMPIMNGYETARMARMNANLRQTAFIDMLDTTPRNQEPSGLRRLGDGFLLKPVRRRELHRELGKFLPSVAHSVTTDSSTP